MACRKLLGLKLWKMARRSVNEAQQNTAARKYGGSSERQCGGSVARRLGSSVERLYGGAAA
jgi:hypothetical protein